MIRGWWDSDARIEAHLGGPGLIYYSKPRGVDGWMMVDGFFSKFGGKHLGALDFLATVLFKKNTPSSKSSTGSREKWEATLMNPTSPMRVLDFRGMLVKETACWAVQQKHPRHFGHLEVGFSKQKGAKALTLGSRFGAGCQVPSGGSPGASWVSHCTKSADRKSTLCMWFWVYKVFAANHFKSFTQIDWFFKWNFILIVCERDRVCFMEHTPLERMSFLGDGDMMSHVVHTSCISCRPPGRQTSRNSGFNWQSRNWQMICPEAEADGFFKSSML